MSGVVYIGKIESKILNKEVLMVKYNKAKRIMEEYEELCDFVGEFGEDVVEETEKILNVMLPKSYKSFLRDFGAGNFGSQEIYGIVNSEFNVMAIPDVTWLTLSERNTNDLPHELIPIYYDGGEFYYCIDTGEIRDGESPIVSINVGELSCNKQILFDSFGEFLMDVISLEI